MGRREGRGKEDGEGMSGFSQSRPGNLFSQDGDCSYRRLNDVTLCVTRPFSISRHQFSRRTVTERFCRHICVWDFFDCVLSTNLHST